MERYSLLKKNLFQVPAYLVLGGLLFPLFVFLFQSRGFQFPEGVSWFSSIAFTFFQAGVSTFLILIGASLGALGLLHFYFKKYYILLKTFALLPALIPPLILVISFVNFVELFSPFSFGLGALICAQVITYTGLCSVALTSALVSSVSSLSEWAFVHGVRPFSFFKACLKTYLRKDLITLGVLVFCGAFTSLSLPLLIAGNFHFSLEFFIYEKLKQPEMWGQAATLILMQTLFIFFICLKAFSFSSPPLDSYKQKVYLLKNPKFIVFSIWPAILLLVGLLGISSFQWREFLSFKSLLLSSLASSLLLSFGVGCLTLVGLGMLCFSYNSIKARKLISSYLNPGVTLLGFSFLLFSPVQEVHLKWILGLTLLFFPTIYRLRGESILEKLKEQVAVAEIFGASPFMIFKCVLWPQARSLFLFCSGIAAFWACGDFAYSLIVSQGTWNLALVVYDLFSSYRIDLALMGSWILLLVSVMVFLFWIGVDFVFRKRSLLRD